VLQLLAAGCKPFFTSILQLWEKFRGSDAAVPELLGPNRDYNIDLVPKFMMVGVGVLHIALSACGQPCCL